MSPTVKVGGIFFSAFIWNIHKKVVILQRFSTTFYGKKCIPLLQIDS